MFKKAFLALNFRFYKNKPNLRLKTCIMPIPNDSILLKIN